MVLLEEMLEAAKAITGYAHGLTRDTFLNDARTVDAVCMRLLTLGESAGALLRAFPDFESRFPEIPWRAMSGLRNHIAHDYFSLDQTMVWETAIADIPPLIGQLEQLLNCIAPSS
ncbi:HepT-like ribonuclease domain-containing protein [Solidesulfovibrio sp.]